MICSFHSKFPTQNPPRSTQKNPFCIQIKYGTMYNFALCRRLADEGDSKSLVLITRVGSTPTTGIKKLPQLVWGSFLFYLRRVSGSNSTVLTKNAPEMWTFPHLPVRMVYRSGNGAVLFCAAASAFYKEQMTKLVSNNMKNYTFDYKLLNEDHQQKNRFIGRLQSSVAFISKICYSKFKQIDQ